MGGGFIAAYFLTRESIQPLAVSDGAIVGVFAGMIGAVVAFLISIPLSPLEDALARSMTEWISEYADQVPEFWQSFMEDRGLESSIPFMALELLINMVVFSLLSALGGVVGISIFKKKTSLSAQGVIDAAKDEIAPETPDNHQS